MFRSKHSDFPQAYESWSEVRRSWAGVPEVSAHWLGQNGDSVRVIDVRGADELTGPMGHIAGVELVPMMSLLASARNWRRDEKIVLVCASGNRSGRGALLLEQMGFTHVASLAGGMLAWNQYGFPVAYER